MADVENQKPSGDTPATKTELAEVEEEKPAAKSLTTKIWTGVASLTVIVNIAAIIFSLVSFATIIAGGIASIIALVVIKFQFELQDIDTLRQVQNQLRRNVNRFSKANDALTANVDNLESEVGDLKVVEQKLDGIAKQAGKDLNRLQEIVKENQIIIDKKKELLKADTMQSILDVVMLADKDDSGDFSDAEINRLIVRLKGLPAIHINEDKMREKLNKKRSVFGFMDLLQELDDESIPKEKKIVYVNEDEYQPEEDY